MAATADHAFPSQAATMPSPAPIVPASASSASSPYPSTTPMQPGPYGAPPSANAHTVVPQPQMQPPPQPMYGQPYAPSPYAYAPPPIQVVVQNQIQMPVPMMPAPYVVPAYPPVLYARRKDPGVAVLCSFFLPGGGQLYNGQVGKGLAFIVATLINVALLFVGIGVLTGLATWIWAMIDAHSTAERINRGV